MSQVQGNLSRRDIGKLAGGVAAASALTALNVPGVYAAENNTIQVALVGCGGRGTGAAANALSVNSPMKLVAMADVFPNRQKGSFETLKNEFKDKIDVPDDRKFIGFDAYKHAIDCLRPGDIAIFATPPAFRWVHFTYAIQKGVNVFMEKPVTVDGPTSKRMFGLGEQASAKNLKVGVGLMSRHSRALAELAKRIHDGQIGDVIMMRGYRMHGPVGYFASLKKPAGISELMYQVQRFHSMLWAGGGCFSDFYIHVIDHLCWMKNAWPVKCQALGGRHYKNAGDGSPYIDQNFDAYACEYTFEDGAKLLFDGRCMNNTANFYNSFIHGSKGMAVGSRNGDCGTPSIIYSSQNEVRANRVWQSTDDSNPYQNEWDDLVAAIRNDKPYNEVQRGVQASLVTSMGRMAAHTGQEITYDGILNFDHEFAPNLDKLTSDSPAPVQPDANGVYPQPEPGQKKREY